MTGLLKCIVAGIFIRLSPAVLSPRFLIRRRFESGIAPHRVGVHVGQPTVQNRYLDPLSNWMVAHSMSSRATRPVAV
jgi:hypothetical protein